LDEKRQQAGAPGVSELIGELRRMRALNRDLPAERELARQLGINRHMLRQGLQFLRGTGEIEPAKLRVQPPRSFKGLSIINNTSPVELWETRLSMEPQVARAAALRATPNEIEAIRVAHQAAKPNIFEAAQDNDFHRKIALASHNTLWAVFVDLLTAVTIEESFTMQLPPFTAVTGYDHHADILQAIEARDAVTAERVMHAHLSAIQRWVMGLEPLPE
jgi:DNA-binding FadR family transcriptional regulator